jgi:hypothetical protein
MNKKMIGAVLGTLAFGSMTIARAEDAPAKPEKAEKGKKAKKAKAEGDKKGGEKSCGADGKSCSGKK